MASWREIRCWLQSRSVTFVGGEEWAGICWPPQATALGKTTVVNVVHVEEGTAERLVASAHVAAAHELSVREFLRWNGRLRGGVLVFQRDEVFVRRSLDLASATLDDVDAALDRLAESAASIRLELANEPTQEVRMTR